MSVVRYCWPKLRKAILAKEEPAWLVRHSRRSYIVAAILSAPPWVKRSDFDAVVALKDELTAETGKEHVLDHIIPLNHPRVCGLTVPWNMEPLPRPVNGAKGNYFCPEQDEIQYEFTPPKQLELML